MNTDCKHTNQTSKKKLANKDAQQKNKGIALHYTLICGITYPPLQSNLQVKMYS